MRLSEIYESNKNSLHNVIVIYVKIVMPQVFNSLLSLRFIINVNKETVLAKAHGRVGLIVYQDARNILSKI